MVGGGGGGLVIIGTATPTAAPISTRRMLITIARFLDLQNDTGGDVPLGSYISSLP